MALERDELLALARLARLAVSDVDVRSVTADVSRIVDFVEQLQRVDTGGVEPMAHPLGDLTQRLREDEVAHENRRERYQDDAPAAEDGFYVVPKVIE